MDKDILQEVNGRKKRKLTIYAVIVLVFIGAGIAFARRVFRSSIGMNEITTAVVERGSIENTISASGEILPEFEQVISSPITASVQKVFVDAGMQVRKGQPLLTLDKENTRAEYERLRFGLEEKKNELQKLKLELEKSFADLRSSNDIKQLRINSLKASLEDAKRLYKAGGGTREDIERAELNLKVAGIEKLQLENEIRTKQQSMRIEMKESQIAADIQANNLKELERKLSLADIVANREGVVTWIDKNIGASIREGEALVRIADLSGFKVSGVISDNYLDQLHNNMAAIVRINDNPFRGRVTNINPAVHSGLISFDIQLDDRKNNLFRPNMKVDVFLVTEIHNNILKVQNGPAFKGALIQEVFVVSVDKAERKTVHTGLFNFDYVELKDNVKEGERIIISDMSKYINTQEIHIH